MIVRRLPDSLQFITQPDHAHLARRLMERCLPLRDRPRHDSILHAIGEHDNGWTEEDAAPTVNPATGGVFDFVSIPVNVRHRVWPRGVKRLTADPWAAALVAHHAVTVYDRFRPDTEWNGFFHEMESLRDHHVRLCEVRLNELLDDYVFVRVGDLISLTYCTGWSDEQGYAEWRVRRSGTRVEVTPDAFGGDTVPFEVHAREIRNRPFAHDDDLRDALADATVMTLSGEAR